MSFSFVLIASDTIRLFLFLFFSTSRIHLGVLDLITIVTTGASPQHFQPHLSGPSIAALNFHLS